MQANRSEKGQALVLIVLGVVVLFGFAALAVDMGRTYAERRRAQNAADASAFAAAFAMQNAKLNHTTVTETQLEQIVFDKAQKNGFSKVIGSDPTHPRVDIVYHHPPTSGPYAGKDEYYQVLVTTTVDQAFSQIVFKGTQRLTVEAVARSRPARSVTPGDAMFATNEGSCPAIQFSGSGTTNITGGNVFSNSNGSGKTSGSGTPGTPNSCDAMERNGSGSVNVNGGFGVYSVGPYVDKGASGSANPAPQGGQEKKNIPDLPLPDCSNLPARTFDKNNSTLLPGRYSGGIDIQNGTYTMQPGMYCLYSSFHINGGSLTGKFVMIVQWNGDIDFNGNAIINLTRPNDLVDGARQHWGGMLIFMPSSNHSGIDLSGGGGTTYTGTIYAPSYRDSSKPKCTVGGNSGSVGLNSNLICNTIQVGGTGDVIINYQEDQNFRLPPIVELAQ